ncbi:hypothetical protein OF829_11695 [Sphingomonas sp. LB-2]|uniref:hypothetical protein n=1 Tax=Sphingomonas caeni TaxID=2984949 RepID=UPI00223093FD|nr:hypothetical protein [Sphingomonas caeni]MCW3847904.1 hypothetical protein [Sphingomonas caeni]
MTDMAPIACTLDGGSFKTRMAWIADLNARVLKAVRRNDLRLELDYAPSALADVRLMVAQEQECCAFLNFELTEGEDVATLAITAPETARDAAEALFGPFQGKTLQATDCGCTGGCGA